MKKTLVLLASSLGAAILFILSSCAKEDTTPPLLTLTLGNNVIQPLPTIKGKGVWVDPGYTATDNGQNLFTSVHVFGTVDPNTKGLYTLTYSVKDASGNVSTQTRAVHIYNDADSLAGTYAVTDSTVSPSVAVTGYAVTLSSDMNVDSLVHFDKFAGLNNDSTVYARANHLAFTMVIPHQTVTFWRVTPGVTETHAFIGSGRDSVGALIPTVIHLTYTDSTAGSITVHHTRWTK